MTVSSFGMIQAHADTLGITINELLKRAKVDRSQLSNWRAQKTKPSAATLEKCLKVQPRKRDGRFAKPKKVA